MLSRALKQACPVLQNSIRFSSKIIKEIHPENDEIAILKMNSPPVNPLSRPFLKDLHNAILECEQDEDIRGLILTSNKTGVFSAGLDITEMWRKPEDEVRAFWIQLQDTWRALYSTPLATCAAINGASPAGGCLLSISCDHRIMINHPKFTIGLNETKLGLVAPIWFAKCFQDLLGKRKAERYLYLGSLLTRVLKISVTQK